MAVATLPRRRSGCPPGGYDARRFDAFTFADFGVPMFRGLLCAHCKAGLWDSQGWPRWDITRGVRFVCQGWCRGGEGGN